MRAQDYWGQPSRRNARMMLNTFRRRRAARAKIVPTKGNLKSIRRMNSGFSLSILAGLLFLWGQGRGAAAGALDIWQWRNPLPQGNTLRSIAFGNGTVVAVGEHGTVLSSTNGDAWAIRESGTKVHLAKIAFGNGLFVAVGGSGIVRASRDGSTWEVQNSTTTNDLTSVAYVNGDFLAVGRRGTLLHSTGANWTPIDLGTNGLYVGFRDIASGNGRFVAVGSKYDPGYISHLRRWHRLDPCQLLRLPRERYRVWQ